MSSAVMERQIKGDRKPQVNLCGDCGIAIGANELLCSDCREELRGESMDKDNLKRPVLELT